MGARQDGATSSGSASATPDTRTSRSASPTRSSTWSGSRWGRSRQRALERGGSVLEHRLSVRHEHDLDRQSAEALEQARLQLLLRPLTLRLREPRNRQLDSAVLRDQQVARDERAVVLQIE